MRPQLPLLMQRPTLLCRCPCSPNINPSFVHSQLILVPNTAEIIKAEPIARNTTTILFICTETVHIFLYTHNMIIFVADDPIIHTNPFRNSCCSLWLKILSVNQSSKLFCWLFRGISKLINPSLFVCKIPLLFMQKGNCTLCLVVHRELH